MSTRKRTRSQGLGDHDSQPGSSHTAATASQSLSSPESVSPDGENIEDIITTAQKRTKRIQNSTSSLQRSVDLLCKEVLEYKNQTRDVQQQLTRVLGLKEELKGIFFMLLPF